MKLVRKTIFENSICKKVGRIVGCVYIYIYIYLLLIKLYSILNYTNFFYKRGLFIYAHNMSTVQ